jgi:hypothetical protein
MCCADAKLCLFFELYRNSVVPTFLRLMGSRSMDQWLLEMLATHAADHDPSKHAGGLSGFNPVGFWAFSAYLDSEFAVARAFDRPKTKYSVSWEAGAASSLSSAIPPHRRAEAIRIF